MRAGHLAELELRCLQLGELPRPAAQEAQAHAHSCPACQERLREQELEGERFRREISFERFASGVEEKRRAAQNPVPAGPRMAWASPALGMAAAAAVVLLLGQPLLRQAVRTKGGANVVLRIAGPLGGPQRLATPDAPEPLLAGERVRIGYKPGAHRYVAAVSIDESGTATPLYPEFGTSLPADEGDATYYLPESVEFLGKGAEAVVVVLSDEALDVGDVARAARRAFEEAHGDVRHLGLLHVPGEQFQRVFLKP